MRAAGAGADGALQHIVRVLRLLLNRLAEIAKERAGKEVGTLGETRYALVIDEGRRFVAAPQRFEGVRALTELAPRVGLAVERRLRRALAEQPGRAVRGPAALARWRQEGFVDFECTGRRDDGQAETIADVGIEEACHAFEQR